MNYQNPFKISTIDFSKIIIKKEKVIKNKKIFFLKYKENKTNNFVIQLSDIKNNNVLSSNEIEFMITDSEYINFFENLDNYIINLSKNNINWFNLDNSMSIDYKRILNNNNSLKLKLCNNNELQTKIVINNENVDNFDDIDNNNSTTKIILEIYAIWIKSSSIGLLIRPININMKINTKLSYNYKFLDESEYNDSDNESDNESLLFDNIQSEINNNNNMNLFMKNENKNFFMFNENTTSTISSNEIEEELNKLILK